MPVDSTSTTNQEPLCYDEYIAYLDAQAGTQGIRSKKHSRRDFQQFLLMSPPFPSAGMSVTRDGYFSVEWGDQSVDYASIMFIGNNQIRYTIYKNNSSKPNAKLTEVGSLNEFYRTLSHYNLERLLWN